MDKGGRKPAATIWRLWIGVVPAPGDAGRVRDRDSASGELKGDQRLRGRLVVMLIDSMIPEAARKAGDVGGLATVVGFAEGPRRSVASQPRLYDRSQEGP